MRNQFIIVSARRFVLAGGAGSRLPSAVIPDVGKPQCPLLQSIPGIKPVVARMLIAGLSELGCFNSRSIASMVGIAPINRDSGVMQGRRTTWCGRVRISVSRSTWRPWWRPGTQPADPPYDQLVMRGKPPKVALTVVMRLWSETSSLYPGRPAKCCAPKTVADPEISQAADSDFELRAF